MNEISEEQIREATLRELYDGDEGSLAPLGAPDDWPTEEGYVVRDVTTFEDTFDSIFQEAFDLLIQRQRKYGPDNISQQGMWGVLTRIADDKIARLRRAFNGRIVAGQIALDPVAEPESGQPCQCCGIPQHNADDSFEDACLDLMNYAAILLALKRGEWGRPLSDER